MEFSPDLFGHHFNLQSLNPHRQVQVAPL